MKRFITDHEFYCTQCGKRGLDVIRQQGKDRGAGHLKKLYCLNCDKETNHAECKPSSTKYNYSDFYIEYTFNNFDEEGNRRMPYGLFRAKLHNEGVDINAEKEKINCNVWGAGVR
jgi:hypothetical protein